ncbi:PREDICTED: ubiquitin carboxyl-terminal hydrolase 1-like [Camelina sativa]|uniref:Ubiquitin carboxyl-terminal hydrolase n=1 Tax=Camelina sativa TaxID=90675 RepID=A0ABM0ZB72_CAMSA|nr:PREDICTED: ubiquitin carboxyl-terminal hydrolase 1-like [Camelina sativa]
MVALKSRKGQKPPNFRRPATFFAEKVTKQSVEITEEVVGTMAEKRSCVHFDRYVNVDKLLKTIESSGQIKCGECNEGVHVKGGGSKWSMSRNNRFCFSARKAIWLCLECGDYVCGDVGLPTGSHSHVVRHFNLTGHRLVIQCENPQLRWCFPCQSLVSFEKEENGEKKDLLLEVVELIRELSSNTFSARVETENLWSGSEARDGYAVRGLVNLGNTCFFNSVMQNLLSLDQLREHFLKEDMFGGGPLVSSLKKLFEDTESEVGFFRSAINPRRLFFSVCYQAPQFKGYQQHDSHELLRYLLDGLSFEESSMRQKLSDYDNDDDSFAHQKPTLIDSIFGGEISSTVSCMECGHSSKVFEPFMDLSLPIPSKESPPEKQQTLSPEQKVHNNEGVSKDSEEHDSFWEDIFGLDTEQGDISDTAPSTEARGVNHTLVGSTETLLIHDNDGIVKPETVQDEEDTQSDEDTDESEILSEIEALLADEELPLLVADSQILYLPYKDDISCDDNTVGEGKGGASSYVSGHHVQIDETSISCNNETVQASEVEGSSSNVSSDHEPKIDYVDFSSFFDEPEIPEGPVFRLPSKAEVSEAGFVAVSSNDKKVQASEGEGSSPYVNGDHERDIDNFQFRSFLDELEISERAFDRPKSQSEAGFMAMSSNEKTVRPGEGEAYSSFMSCDHKQQDRDYGPEISERPVFGPPSKAKVSEVGFMAVSSDSDPEVVDDSPVSVDGCLAQFTKPEILSEENAWHCENCSKNLKLQRLREKRETKLGLSNGWVDENEAIDECIDVENSCKAGVTELLNCKKEKNAIDDGVLGDSDAKQDPITSYVTETPILGGETISSQPANGYECENWEDRAVDSEEVIVKRAATKRVLVNKAPPVLTIHLKRFSQDARGRLSKLRGHVDFKEYLDLSQYMDNTRLTEEDQPVYRLAGLVEHLGTMRGGHYIAYIRGGDKTRRESNSKEPNSSIWYHASDAWVRRVSFEEVLRSEAYILFYERI